MGRAASVGAGINWLTLTVIAAFHAGALAALFFFAYEAWWFGFGTQLLAVALPFGVVSIAISWWRSRTKTGTY